MNVSCEPLLLLDISAEEVLLQALAPHPEDDVHPEIFHGIEVFTVSIFHEDGAQSYLLDQFFVDLSVEHGLENLFVGGSYFLEVFPGLPDDLS